jgi:hypothetical protein
MHRKKSFAIINPMRKIGLYLVFALAVAAGAVSAFAAQSDKPFPDPATVVCSTG